jgi:hypothetical protein
VPLLREALKTNPTHAAAHWDLGYAYRFAGMLPESEPERQRARQIDPLVQASGSVFNTYLYLGEDDKSLRSLPEVNDSAFVLFYRGFGEYSQNQGVSEHIRHLRHRKSCKKLVSFPDFPYPSSRVSWHKAGSMSVMEMLRQPFPASTGTPFILTMWREGRILPTQNMEGPLPSPSFRPIPSKRLGL